jgi:hypothetical protein
LQYLNLLLSSKEFNQQFNLYGNACKSSLHSLKIRILTNSLRDKSTNELCQYLILSCENGNLLKLSALINFENFSKIPLKKLKEALLIASRSGHLDIVNTLMNCEKISAYYLGKALLTASRNNHPDIVSALMNCEKILGYSFKGSSIPN